MMGIRPFHHPEDLPLLKSWLQKRGISEEIADDIPSTGVVAFDAAPVAIGFIRMTEGMSTSWLEGLTTDPEAHPEDRHLALDTVVQYLFKKAKDYGTKNIMAYTTEESVLQRSYKHGFTSCPHVLIGMKLEEGD